MDKEQPIPSMGIMSQLEWAPLNKDLIAYDYYWTKINTGNADVSSEDALEALHNEAIEFQKENPNFKLGKKKFPFEDKLVVAGYGNLTLKDVENIVELLEKAKKKSRSFIAYINCKTTGPRYIDFKDNWMCDNPECEMCSSFKNALTKWVEEDQLERIEKSSTSKRIKIMDVREHKVVDYGNPFDKFIGKGYKK